MLFNISITQKALDVEHRICLGNETVAGWESLEAGCQRDLCLTREAQCHSSPVLCFTNQSFGSWPVAMVESGREIAFPVKPSSKNISEHTPPLGRQLKGTSSLTWFQRLVLKSFHSSAVQYKTVEAVPGGWSHPLMGGSSKLYLPYTWYSLNIYSKMCNCSYYCLHND